MFIGFLGVELVDADGEVFLCVGEHLHDFHEHFDVPL